MPRINEPLDIFGQNPRLSQLYTQLCFCFPIDAIDGDAQSIAYNTISKGLAELALTVPWITGHVAQDKRGLYTVVPLKNSVQLEVKDLSNELPSFDHYRDSCFPFAWLDEATIAPCRTFSGALGEHAPVLCLQLNYVRGGALLVVNAQHNCMDLRGQAEIIYLLSKTCRGDQLSNEETGPANMSTMYHSLLGFPGSGESIALPITHIKPQHNDLENDPADRAYFNFTSEALQTLKDTASSDCSTAYVSTDDTLCAFVWQAVTRARAHRIELDQLMSTFERQVDSRKHVNIPASYIGNVVCKVSVQMACKDLLAQTLGTVASRLREAISPEADIGLKTRTAASRLREALLDSTQKPAPRTTVQSLDIKMSSWAKEDCCDYDFGLLGKAEAVRRPAFDAWEGLAYTMPKTKDGQIAVALCLRPDDMEALRQDTMFTQYGTYVG